MRWARPAIRRSLYFVLCYGVIVLVFSLLETALMYPAPSASEGDWSPNWLRPEVAHFSSPDGTPLYGWYCEHPQAEMVLLICHGNGEHVAFMAEELAFLREHLQASVFAFDYRGYGHSGGRPHEAGILADAEAAHQWLAERAGIAKQKIVLWGRSLGGAVAVHLAAKNGAAALILDRTFSSMVEVAARHFPWLPIRLFLRNRYQAQDWIQSYRGPLVQIHGKADEIVPLELGRKLFEASPSAKKEFLTDPQLSHNVPWPESFYDRVKSFIQQSR